MNFKKGAIIGLIVIGVAYAALTIGYINRGSRWPLPRPPMAAMQRKAYYKNNGQWGPVLTKDKATSFAYRDLTMSIIMIIVGVGGLLIKEK